MKIYSNTTVYQESLSRVERIYSEFDNVLVSSSGGKDSTVILNLALEVATKLDRLPVTVVYVDQEAEWDEVSEYFEELQKDDRINLMWFQMPLRMSNNTSNQDEFLYCWREEGNWLREKNPHSIHENVYENDRFYTLFEKITRHHWPDSTVAWLTGMRAQESPKRAEGATTVATYKDITWGKIVDKRRGYYNFHPIYDWEISDVWLYIHSNKLLHCEIYNKLYALGVKVVDMRVSNLHHETAIQNLWLVQEIAPELWAKLVDRIDGVNSCDKLKQDGYSAPKKLPYMFRSWTEYRDYLLDKLITNPESMEKFLKRFGYQETRFEGMFHKEVLYKAQVKEIIRNDTDGVMTKNFELRPDVRQWFKFKKYPEQFVAPAGYKNRFTGHGYEN